MPQHERLVEIRFPSNADRLRLVREVVRQAASLGGFHADQAERLVLAVNEACMNVIQHAYGSDHAGDVVLEINSDGEQLTFTLTDFAKPVDCSCIKSRDLNDVRPGGLGVHMICEVMDHVDYCHAPEGNGNVLVMKKTISTKEGQTL
jgi:anti-sigma regulatory factor (Ser/Thr protein kinase)